MDKNEAWDYLMENYGVSEQTLRVVTCINGFTMETLEDVLYAVAAERSFPDDDEEADDEEDDDEEDSSSACQLHHDGWCPTHQWDCADYQMWKAEQL